MDDAMTHLDEGTIHAWLDDALGPADAARAAAHITSCPTCTAAVAEARGLIAASSRILAELDSVPSGVVPGTSGRTDHLDVIRRLNQRARAPWWRTRRFLAAASLVFMAGTATAVWRASGDLAISEQTAVESDAGSRSDATSSAEPGRQSVPVSPGTPSRNDAIGQDRLSVETPAPTAAPREPSSGTSVRDSRSPAAAPSASNLAPGSPPAEVGRLAQATQEAKALAGPPPAQVQGGAAQAQSGAAPVQGAAQIQTRAAQEQVAGEQRARLNPTQDRATAARLAPTLDSIRSRTTVVQLDLTQRRSMRLATPPQAGCYELRGPAPVGGRLLGVPGFVRLLDELAPQGPDSTWMRAADVDGPDAGTTLIWRPLDTETAELRVRRQLDSTVVRFRTSPVDPPRSAYSVPDGVVAAMATRVVCR
jgi:anti-sigma factor RsiW